MSEQDPNKGSEEAPKQDAGTDNPEPRPAETFKQGMSLLWKAARSVGEEIKREVDKGEVSDALRQAGQDLEVAANQAAKALEDFVSRMGPGAPKTSPWPTDQEPDATEAKQADADIPEDGGTTESGEKRDMRIQVDEKDDS